MKITTLFALSLALGCPRCETEAPPMPDDGGPMVADAMSEADAGPGEVDAGPDLPDDLRSLERVPCSSNPGAELLGCYGDDVVCVDDFDGTLRDDAVPSCFSFGAGDATPVCSVGVVQIGATPRCLACITSACDSGEV